MADGMVAGGERQRITNHRAVRPPFGGQAVDRLPVDVVAVDIDHRQRARAVAERAAHGDPDPPGADVKAEHGHVGLDLRGVHASTLYSDTRVISTPSRPAAACERTSTGGANSPSAAAGPVHPPFSVSPEASR